LGKLPPRCMWPDEPGNLRVPASGRKSMMNTIRICSQPARWRILHGDERVYVCDHCKPAALKTYADKGDVVVESYSDLDQAAD